jgi:hypothetical protein
MIALRCEQPFRSDVDVLNPGKGDAMLGALFTLEAAMKILD